MFLQHYIFFKEPRGEHETEQVTNQQEIVSDDFTFQLIGNDVCLAVVLLTRIHIDYHMHDMLDQSTSDSLLLWYSYSNQ